MDKRNKIEYLFPKKGDKNLKIIVWLLLAAFLLAAIWSIVTQKERREKFQRESKPFKTCATLDSKYIKPGNLANGGNRPPQPVVIFKTNALRCKYYPPSREWAELKADQKYLIRGRADGTRCRVEKVAGRCEAGAKQNLPTLN